MRPVPWWLVILTCGGGAILATALFSSDYRAVFTALGRGVWVTIWVTVVAYSLSLVCGTVLALALGSRHRWLSELTRAWVELVRGIPMVVLLYFIAFAAVPPAVSAYRSLFAVPIEAGILPALTVRDLGFEARAVAALAVAYSAFIAEIIRGGIAAVPRGQSEAAQALGLSRFQTMRHVVLPQAFRTMLPPLGNDLISMLKDSSLVSVLGVLDITLIGKTYSSANFMFFETYLVVAFYYAMMTIGLSLLVRRLEDRLHRSEARRGD